MAQTFNHPLPIRNLLVHAAGMAVAVLLAGSAWKAGTMLQTRQASLHGELRAVTELVSKDRDIRAKHEQLAKKIQTVHDAHVNRKSEAVSPPNDAQLLAELSKLANSVDLSIKSYSPGQSSASGLEAQISATANYAGVCRFLNGLSTASFLCEVTQCVIAAPQQDDGLCTLELSIRVVNLTQVHTTLTVAEGVQ